MNYFVYKGVRSSDMGLRIEKKEVFSAPKYDVEFLSIPGRSGELIAGGGRFPNAQITSACSSVTVRMVAIWGLVTQPILAMILPEKAGRYIYRFSPSVSKAVQSAHKPVCSNAAT